jgi:hypothetical protein
MNISLTSPLGYLRDRNVDGMLMDVDHMVPASKEYWTNLARQHDKKIYTLGGAIITPSDKILATTKIPLRSAPVGMICLHCQSRGGVITKSVKRKKGISGAKATGALLTLGWSLFATGLSRKEEETEAHCTVCGAKWHY